MSMSMKMMYLDDEFRIGACGIVSMPTMRTCYLDAPESNFRYRGRLPENKTGSRRGQRRRGKSRVG